MHVDRYAKQNKVKKRGAVPARLMADMMKMAGAHHIITVDLNPAQMLGFFHTPCDNMMIWPLFQQYVFHRKRDWGDCIVVAKNPGASKRAARLAKMLDLDIALVLDRGEEDDDSGGEYCTVSLASLRIATRLVIIQMMMNPFAISFAYDSLSLSLSPPHPVILFLSRLVFVLYTSFTFFIAAVRGFPSMRSLTFPP